MLATTGEPLGDGSSGRTALEAERRHSRTKNGWYARWQALTVAVSVAETCPFLGSETLAKFANILDNAVTALSNRDILAESVFLDLYAPIARYIPADSLDVDPVAPLLARYAYPLARIERELNRTAKPAFLRVFTQRSNRTLQDIAADMGLTRERIRQIEAKVERLARLALFELAPELVRFWRRALAAAAVSEDDLIHPFVERGAAGEAQVVLARSLLRSIEATIPTAMREIGLGGYWTLNPEALGKIAGELESVLPCTAEQLDETLEDMPLSEARALKQLFRAGWGKFRLHQFTNYWVRAGSQDRDAAWLALIDEGKPLSADELGFKIGLSERNVSAQLARDSRVARMKPSGHWALATAQHATSYSTTLEAALEALRKHGPLSLGELTARVQESYPVTPAAVGQCVNHHLIGLTTDGRLDLVENGASRIVRKEPRRPADVLLETGGRLKITRRVDVELLRGSGVGVSPYVSWFLGLESAPSSRRFNLGEFNTVRIDYRISGSSISSLRTVAEQLDARVGCMIALILDPMEDRATAHLECGDHDHPGEIT